MLSDTALAGVAREIYNLTEMLKTPSNSESGRLDGGAVVLGSVTCRV